MTFTEMLAMKLGAKPVLDNRPGGVGEMPLHSWILPDGTRTDSISAWVRETVPEGPYGDCIIARS